MAVKKYVPPKTPAGAADRWYELRAKRLELAKQVAAMEAEESLLREYIIDNLPKSQASGITGRVAHAEIEVRPVPQVKSWPLFYKHIIQTKDFSLLQRRVNDGAIKERWAAKKTVPGVGRFNAVVVSLTKK